MLKPHHGLDKSPRYNGDERSSRDPNVYIARAKQVAANRKEWERRAHEAALTEFTAGDWIIATQLENLPVTYRNGHLELA